MVCDTKPSYYQEKWVRGMAERRQLCKRSYGAAVERDQKKVRPLPFVIKVGTMERVEASIDQ